MKKTITLALTIILLSCSNEHEEINDTISENIPEIQYFNSKTDFEKKIKSIEINNSEQLISNEYNILSEVLNKDNIIGIGDHLIKVDLDTESVYLLNKSFLDQYNDLANINLKNNNITQLSIYEDVLGFLDGSNTLLAKPACTSTPAPYDYDYQEASAYYRYIAVSASYSAYGIYFKLRYQCVLSDSGYSRFEEWDITYQTTNCVNYSSYGENEDGDGEHDGNIYATIYSSTVPLGSFHCFVSFSSSAGTASVTIES
ncbi:hypothetical protein Q4Q35_00385 [Flavivirga aquimarina]|uniref:DUF5033 domain-containing protein n=1 Tax=Flavivirga aquimarina TaxID=2027862 RepID=A0ABT8W552_9FLAO|nr:hypothetical protein [Flavivirga aquimarina]MDO5968251.1 hypothetical protein [Flavivirga aquimarina]